MAFDPTKPADHAPLSSTEMRAQLTALKAVIDAQQAQIGALQAALNETARNPGWSELDPGFHTPPTFADLESVRVYINNLVAALAR